MENQNFGYVVAIPDAWGNPDEPQFLYYFYRTREELDKYLNDQVRWGDRDIGNYQITEVIPGRRFRAVAPPVPQFELVVDE